MYIDLTPTFAGQRDRFRQTLSYKLFREGLKGKNDYKFQDINQNEATYSRNTYKNKKIRDY